MMQMTRHVSGSAAAVLGLLILGGCHLPGIVGTSGALIGGAVADRPGAMIGGGAGLLVGVLAEVFLYKEHPQLNLSACGSLRGVDEQRMCEEKLGRSEEYNARESTLRAERYGYDMYRQGYRY